MQFSHKAMRFSVVLFSVFFFHSRGICIDYIIDVPGTKTTLKGTTVIVGVDTYSVVQTQLTKDAQPQTDPAQVWIIHENRTVVGDQQEKTQVRAYCAKPDGMYCVAQSGKPGQPLETLNQPYKVIPIPALNDVSWDVKFLEDGKKVNLKYRVINADETVTIAEKSYQTLHLKAEGDVEVFGMHVPITKDIWWEKSLGVIKSVSIQKIQDKETRTELLLAEPL